MQHNGKKINVLIVGTGHYSTGSTVLEGERQTDKDFGVLLPSILELHRRGVVDRVLLAGRDGSKIQHLKEKVERMASKFGWDASIEYFPQSGAVDEVAYRAALQALPTPGIVLIATPDHTHAEIINAAIAGGFHYLVVKPAVSTVAELEELIKATDAAKKLGLVDFHKVYDEANLILKDEYAQGRYGDLQHVLSIMSQRRDMLHIFKKWAGKGGHTINHYLGSHYIHMVGFITGATPLSVRATAQYGVAKNDYGINTPDLIETQVQWRAKNGSAFTSYHVAGWADPSETAGMTYQEMHLIGTRGRIDTDQRFRGLETVLVGEGQRISNPYFFHMHAGLLRPIEIEHKYGFRSIEVAITAALEVESGADPRSYEGKLPTIRDSYTVTAILEAADQSLAQNSSIVAIAPKNIA